MFISRYCNIHQIVTSKQFSISLYEILSLNDNVRNEKRKTFMENNKRYMIKGCVLD